ncbi:hypothetical protein WKW79_35900 [Variovorax robiniae]|uniref:Immunity protein 52 domain-containing protein n=1 Tax=Variovorax robiniae TaxID=1836199 RepID=A0ABU8XJH2_9BURK
MASDLQNYLERAADNPGSKSSFWEKILMYQRKTPQRIRESLCEAIFDRDFINQLRSLFYDETHLSLNEIHRRKWISVHALNSGEIDTERDALIGWWRERNIPTIYATSKQAIDNAPNNNLLVVRLENPSSDDLLDLQLGLWMFPPAGAPPFRYEWDTWRDGLYFSVPLQFAILREVDFYGATTISGPPDLIERVKLSATHGDYFWSDGPLLVPNQG